MAPSSGWKATSRTYFALNGHAGPEEKLPHRTLHMDERQRRLEWITFVAPTDWIWNAEWR